jgi:hypothetical protein
MRNTLVVAPPKAGVIAGKPAASARFELEGKSYFLPRYLFIGPKGEDAPVRAAIFAGIHGDESGNFFRACLI